MPYGRLLKIVKGRRHGQTSGFVHRGKPHGADFRINIHIKILPEKLEKNNR
jgi:hypothetical protein